MDPEVTAEEVRQAQFSRVLRGVDRTQVEALLEQVAAKIDQLEAEKQRLVTQVGDSALRDLESEFDEIGREVSLILQVAQEAADSMRERASLDAARWRGEAMTEAEANRRDASADAEALRRDAWATGTQLLGQTANEIKSMREEAQRDVLTIMGEAEREAHRLTSGARRDAEDRVRSATMDAEKLTSEATKRRDDLIDQASRQSAAAQERTRALEQRRDELLEELENVRTTLTRLEGSLEEKRETSDPPSPDSTSVRVVPPDPVEKKNWELGETVRVVKEAEPEPEPEDESEPEPELLDQMVAPIEDLAPAEELPPPMDERIPSDPPAEKREDDEVGALFASLRGSGLVEEPPVSEEVSPPSEPEPEPSRLPADATDWIEERDARLLPITNRALRGSKRSISELQNIALDSLRTDEEWRPDQGAIAEAVRADLLAVWAESFAAGHSVAEAMTGSKLNRPTTPPSDAVTDFASALTEAVVVALDESGDGQRERQSAASRVFRIWRSDEAGRRIRELAIHAYEMGIEMSVTSEAPVG